nr:pirin-like C-terminal cupin domain-containing protein [Rhodococcus sp. NCIMB 12038]
MSTVRGEPQVELTASSRGARFLVGSGVPLNQPAFMLGGFCLSSEARTRAAVSRYRAGEMHGLLTAP